LAANPPADYGSSSSARFVSAKASAILMSRGQAALQLKIVRQRQTPLRALSASSRPWLPWSRLSNRKRCALTIAAGPT
jgi:hypothetical protein